MSPIVAYLIGLLAGVAAALLVVTHGPDPVWVRAVLAVVVLVLGTWGQGRLLLDADRNRRNRRTRR